MSWPLMTTMSCLVAAAGALAQNSTVTCANGLMMFVSRGTGEPMGLGVTEALVSIIKDRVDGSDYTAILYPADGTDPFSDLSYFASVANGTMQVRSTMTAYAEACPNSKMAWFGYSQGAHITLNSVCGQAPIWSLSAGFDHVTQMDEILEFSSPLSEEVTKNVVAFALFGDPSQRNSTFSHGTWNNTGVGMFNRPDMTACEEAYGGRVRAWCDAGDPFCDVGEYINASAHVRYIQNHGEEIVEWVIDQYRNGGDEGTGSQSESAASATDTPDDKDGAGHLAPMTSLMMGPLLVAYLLH